MHSLPQALYDPQSLTEQLRAAAKHSFAVEIVLEKFIWLSPTEQALLRLSEAEQAWCRCSHLKVDEIIWVQAQTIIPESSLRCSVVEQLRHIGNQPLGTFLFSDPHLTRSPFVMHDTTRSSVFLFHGQPILINETFLPVAIDYFNGVATR